MSRFTDLFQNPEPTVVEPAAAVEPVPVAETAPTVKAISASKKPLSKKKFAMD